MSDSALYGGRLSIDDPRVKRLLSELSKASVKNDGADTHSVHSFSSVKDVEESKERTADVKALVPFRVARNRVAPVLRTPAVPKLPRRRRAPRAPGGPRGWRDVTAGDAISVASRAYSMAKQLWTLLNVEEKKFEVDGTGTVTTTPTVINLSNIAQGTDYNNRVGDSILTQDLEVRVVLSGNAIVNGHYGRVLIVRDKESQGTDPLLSDVLASISNYMVAPANPLYRQRYNVLYDEVFSINNPVGLATAGTSTNYLPTRLVLPPYKRKQNQHIRYDSTAGADASNLEGQLFLMLWSDQASNGPTFAYASQLTFTDN